MKPPFESESVETSDTFTELKIMVEEKEDHRPMACYARFAFVLVVSTISPEAAPRFRATIEFPANASMSWTNNNDSIPAMRFADGTLARLILAYGLGSFKAQNVLHHACGFFCPSESPESCQFAVALVEIIDQSVYKATPPQLVWSANRDRMVGENATLEFSRGNLVLKDYTGTQIWSTGTLTKPVMGISVDGSPNLVLFGSEKETVWQSFDHPTDSLVAGQRLSVGQTLSSGRASENSSSGMFTLSISQNTLMASVHSDISMPYFFLGRPSNATASPRSLLRYASIKEGSLVLAYGQENETASETALQEMVGVPEFHLLRLDSDGGLKAFKWVLRQGWMLVIDLAAQRDPCLPPLRCGEYGVCREGQCSCPMARDGLSYFDLSDNRAPQVGCSQVGSFDSQYDYYKLVDVGGLCYYTYADPQAAVPGIRDLEDRKKACMGMPACRAVFFANSSNNSSPGRCYLPWQVLTMRSEQLEQSSFASSSSYLKVRIPHSASARPPSVTPSVSTDAPNDRKWFLPLNVVIVPVFFVSAVILAVFLRWRRRAASSEEEQVIAERIPGMPVRFSYQQLCVATMEFSQDIGRGRFGTVFRGVLNDGTLVAVKRLDNNGKGMDEFLTEVRTIGSIHHINLVQLIGFCAEKTERLLVYEYMSNGSLDKWIFGNKKKGLDWQTKKKIIRDIAKGLAYLHEGCRQRIAHLDVKPHNILLDEKFNAKISDFGLAKFIDRDRSHVSTTVRGTLGYLAPEWQVSEHITVKADTYSFGIVLLEILCERRNMDYSQSESCIRLLNLLRRKYDENQIFNIVHGTKGDVAERKEDDEEEEEALRFIRLGLWCLRDDYKRRPSMPMVVKVLEGAKEFNDQKIPKCISSSSTIPL